MKNKLSLFLLAALTIVGLSACAWRSNPLADKEQQFCLTGARRQQVLDQIDQRYYYQQLSQAEKENYLLLYDSLSAFHEVTSLAPASKHSLMTTIDAFMMDNPAFFWITSANYRLERSDQVAFVTFPLPEEVEQTYHRLQAIGDDIIADMPATNDYERVRYFYEWIIKQTDYNRAAFEAYQSGHEALIASNQDIRSVFLDHLSVCNGYAQAFQFLCQKAGIPVAYIRGSVTFDRSQDAFTHAWNTVQIAGKNYAVDTTFGDPVFDQNESIKQLEVNYNFLCLPDQLMKHSHQASRDIVVNQTETLTDVWAIPACSDDSLLYAKLNHSYFTAFDKPGILASLEQQLRTNQPQTSLQFANQDLYNQMVSDLEQHSDSYHSLFQAYWPNAAGYFYSLHPNTFSISFINYQ